MNANCIHIYSFINLTIPNFNFDSKVKFGTSHYFFKKSLNTNGNTKKKYLKMLFKYKYLANIHLWPTPKSCKWLPSPRKLASISRTGSANGVALVTAPWLSLALPCQCQCSGEFSCTQSRLIPSCSDCWRCWRWDRVGHAGWAIARCSLARHLSWCCRSLARACWKSKNGG